MTFSGVVMQTIPASLVHPHILERFRVLLKNGRLAHAYLFTGPAGVGKVETALAVARLVNCLGQGEEGCTCPSCTKVRHGNHPDVLVLAKPEDKTEIIIKQVREEIIPKFSMRALEGRYKVLIVKKADLMNAEASNAFLKTLEEPTQYSLIILTTAVPGRLFRTITSRCHEVRFFPLGHTALATSLKNEYDVASVEAMILMKFSGGSPGRALQLGKDFIERKNALLEEFVFRSASEAVLKKFSAEKDAARELCEVLLTFYRDILLAQTGAGDDAFFHRDRAEDIRRLAARYSVDEVERILAQVVKTMEALKESFNVKIALTLLKEMI
jgi:DNA polymerase-3 subunit delta'